MKPSDFVHLHVHSDNSLLDGACTVGSLVERAVKFKHTALALTDHGNMCGAIELYKSARSAGIKPIIGSEIYLVDDIHNKKGGYNHLTILARNEQGYRDLCRLSSIGHTDGFYGRPRVSWSHVRENADNLICLSGCVRGPISTDLRKRGSGDHAAGELHDIFGDRFFLELQSGDFDQQHRVNDECIRLSRKLEIPLVATSDVHYIEKSHSNLQEIKICICHKKTLKDDKRLKIDNDLSYRSTDSIYDEFNHVKHAIKNTRAVADMVDIDLEFGKFHLPKFDTPEGESPEEYLLAQCFRGLKRRYKDITGELEQRLRYELSVINKSGYATYFLVVQDFIEWSRLQGIPVGPGRGSAAGSLASYCLGITDVDPMRHKLLFERFLNPSRVSMPDIDIDFCERRRPEVIEYVKNKYGEECVSQIITFGTLKARSVLRDVARVKGLSYERIDVEAKKIPFEMSLKKFVRNNEDEIARKPKDLRDVYEAALEIEGMKRHAGKHAAGIVIGDKDRKERLPLYRVKGETTTQYTMSEVEDVGLIKMDFLGLRTLTVIKQAEELISASTGKEFRVDDLPEDDEETYKLFSTGFTKGVFQFESDGMQSFLKKAKPTRLEDIIAMTAIYRPGPLGSDMHTKFANRKNGIEEVEYDHPCLEPILNTTYGGIIYQEQVMRIANEIAGFTLPEADTLRKAMGKKKIEIMNEMKPKFTLGCIEKSDMTAQEAESLWTSIEYFSQYGFNLSHAVAYGTVSYRCAYLKAHYPVEFMSAVLTSLASTNEKLPEFISEAKRMGIEILPAHINKSEVYFKPEDGKIRFGFEGIKGIGEAAIDSIMSSRREGYLSLYHFCENNDTSTVSIPVLKALVVAGAFDDFGDHTAQLYKSAPTAVGNAKFSIKELKRTKTKSMFQPTDEDIAIEDRAMLESCDEWTKDERLKKEEEYLGIYLSGHPSEYLRRHAEDMKWESLYTAKDIEDACREGSGVVSSVVLAGVVTSLIKRKSRFGNDMKIICIKDDSLHDCEFVVTRNFLKHVVGVEEGDKVIIRGDIKETSAKDDSLQFKFRELLYKEENSEEAEVPVVEEKPKRQAKQRSLFEGF